MIRKRIHFTSSPNSPLEYPCKTRRHGRRSTSTFGGNIMTQREDILAEILAKLPVKSLMRFRCVSKPWRSLIDKRHFEKMRQAQRGLADNDLRIMFRINPFTSVGLDDLIDKETHLPVPTRRHTFPVSNLDMKNIGSSNGLICIEIKFERSKYMYLLWNPCTGGYKQLPISDIDCISRYFGFGYDSMADDYKIVKGSHFEFNEIATDVLTPIVQVFSLKNSRWETNTCAKGILLIGQGVLLNGFLHWIVYEDRKRSDKQIVIRRFSLSEERFIEDLYAPWFENGGLMAWGKSLCVYSTEGCNDLNIWKMNAYGVKESWTRILGVAVISFRDNWNADYVPICLLPNGNLLLFKRDAIGGRLILYKIGDNKFTDVVVPDVSYLTCHSQVCIYRETLVSPTNI